jgi:hypothetical protein
MLINRSLGLGAKTYPQKRERLKFNPPIKTTTDDVKI